MATFLPSSSYCKFRYYKRPLLGVLLLSAMYFLYGQPRPSYEAQPDLEIALLAQIGYLKQKLAQAKVYPPPDDVDLPSIYVITPTFARPVQKAELTRLSHTLLLVPNLHWIVVEDSPHKTELVTNFLQQSGLHFTHLNVDTPEHMKLKETDHHWSKPRGVFQRNEGLAWIRNHGRGDGVVYFADDDNTYSLELFQQMRTTRRVSVWPVGLVGGLMVEQPLVKGGKVMGWDVGWGSIKKDVIRPFAVDMAGFAVNLKYLLSRPSAKFAYRVKVGYQESEFLKHLVTLDELEPLSVGKVNVWHTQTKAVNLEQEEKYFKKHGRASNSDIEV